jgi:hypothetical protein
LAGYQLIEIRTMMYLSRNRRRRPRENGKAHFGDMRIVLILSASILVVKSLASGFRIWFEEWAGVSSSHSRRIVVRRTRPAIRSTFARLSLFSLEGRLTPSVSPFDFTHGQYHPESAQAGNDATSLDFLVRLSPYAASRDSSFDNSNSAGDPDTPLGLVAVTATMFGSAAVFPYDREEDAAAADWFHGVQVA